MSEEEIKKQYANGIVDIDKLVGSLIDKFKIDKTSVDIQQLQLIAEYLLYKVDKLQKDNYKLDRENQHFFDRIQDLQKENGKLKKELETFNGLKNGTTIMFGAKTQYWRKDKIEKYFISKDIIRTKIKELTGEIHRTKKGRIILKDIKRLAKIEVLKELLGE